MTPEEIKINNALKARAFRAENPGYDKRQRKPLTPEQSKRKYERRKEKINSLPEAQKLIILEKRKLENQQWREANPDYNKTPERIIARKAITKKYIDTHKEVRAQRQKDWRKTDPHRLARTSYSNMIQRCTNPKLPEYARYGGIGILICDRWLESFENFLEDMGDRPIGTTIDRIDNDKGYFKENCRWATDIEQANNCSRNKVLTFNGITQNLVAWEESLGFRTGTLKTRLRRGWSIEEALTTPLDQSYSKEGRESKLKGA